ncbi:MAG TPA: AAA family ATPase [Methylomirabilota bacterium]|nr:AAA family ATPase [Methylomirabilota bacterium]
MRCPNCSTELPDTAKFCLECGQPITRPSATFASPASYTPKHLADKILTSRSALEGERKQVTVLFCDLANSTGLAEKIGPEPMYALLNGFFELALAEVHRYEGTINQFLGDGFMALFGAPLAHEDDGRRAVLAAVAIRKALRDRGSYMGGSDLAVRIGINTGLVVVGSIGDNLRMDYTAVGDTTNVAARLQQVAEPGDVLIAETTARLVRGDMRLLPAGALAVKGKSDPVTAYKVLGPAPRRSALERAGERAFGRFVGRERELRELGDLLERAQAGHGRVVSVIGEAGVGKSRLLYEFRRSLGNLDVTVVEGRCRSYGASIPYLPVLDVVRAVCGIAETDTPSATADKVRGTLAGLGLDTEELAPYVLQLLGMKEGAQALEALTPEVIKRRTIDALEHMFLAASRRRPVILILEDLHWIDEPSEALITGLLDGLEELPLLMLATYRPDYRPPWSAPECTQDIVLRPLSDDESLGVVQSVIQRETLPDSVVRVILDKADGNPLFLEELTRAVSEQGDLRRTLAVPETLQGVLMARIDRLPEVLKRVLQTASVLGREFTLPLLEGIWDGPGGVAAHLAELARMDFVHELSAAPEPGYAFNHALTQEVAYESLLTPQRQALHEAAGRALEAQYAGRLEQAWDGLARHYARSARDDKAVEYLRKVAERSMRAYANAEAIETLEQAQARAARLPDSARLQVELALLRVEALFLLGRFRDCLEALEAQRAAVAALGDEPLGAQYEFRLATVYGVLGDSARALEHGRRVLEAAKRCGDDRILGKAHYLLAREQFWAGRLRQSLADGERAIMLLERSGERWWLAMSHWVLALCHGQLGDFAGALAVVDRSEAIGQELSDPRLVSHALWTRGLILALQGETDRGIAECARGLALAPDAVSRASCHGFLGVAHLEAGDAAAARPHLEQALESFRTFRFSQLESWFLVFLGQATLMEGDVDTAGMLVGGALSATGGLQFWPAVTKGRRILARIALLCGALDEADAHLAEALRLAEESSARFEGAHARLMLAELHATRGDRDGAGRELSAARALFAAIGAPIWVARSDTLAQTLGLKPGSSPVG